MDSSNSSEYSYFTEIKVKNYEPKLLNNNYLFYQIFLFKNYDIIGRTLNSIIIISPYGETKNLINEKINNNKISIIKSMILLKNEELLYGAHSSIYCINFTKNNYEYNVINIIPLKLKEKSEIYQFFQMKDEKIICTTNSTYYMIIQKTKFDYYQIILNIIDGNLMNNGLYELKKYIIFINQKLNIQFNDKINFSYVKNLNLSKYLSNIKNIEFKSKICLNNIIMEINDNIIAISTLGNGIIIININKFVIIKKLVNIDFTCWIKLNDGSFITCEYSDNNNLIRMEQWDINENGKNWNFVSKKDCIHNDFVYSMNIDNNNNIYTAGNDNQLKCWEIHSYIDEDD